MQVTRVLSALALLSVLPLLLVVGAGARTAVARPLNARIARAVRSLSPAKSQTFEKGAALLFAARFGKRIAVRSLLDQGVAPNFRGPGGRTPLLEAADTGSLPAAEILLQHGADVNARDKQGVTPLMEAARRGDVALIRLLLAHGARVDAHNQKGWTALDVAIRDPRTVHDPIVLNLLRQAGTFRSALRTNTLILRTAAP